MSTRLHLIIDLVRDDPDNDARRKRIAVDEIMEEFETEVESLSFEVNGIVFAVKVAGIGRTPKDLAFSAQVRRVNERGGRKPNK